MAYSTPAAFYISTSSGGTVTLPPFDGLERVMFIDGSGTLLTLTINFPSLVADGQRITLCTTQAIATLTLNGVVGSILGSITSMLASSTVRYAYCGQLTKWLLA